MPYMRYMYFPKDIYKTMHNTKKNFRLHQSHYRLLERTELRRNTNESFPHFYTFSRKYLPAREFKVLSQRVQAVPAAT